MTITLEVPDRIARQLGANEEEVGRRFLEVLALRAYRDGIYSHGQVGELLGLSWQATESFLHAHGATLHYELSDLEQDRRAMEALSKQ